MLSFRDQTQEQRMIGFRIHHRSLLTLQHRMPRTKTLILFLASLPEAGSYKEHLPGYLHTYVSLDEKCPTPGEIYSSDLSQDYPKVYSPQ